MTTALGHPPVVDFGMAALATSLGESEETAARAGEAVVTEEQLTALGYRSFRRAAEGVTTADLGAAAGLAALRDAGLPAEAVDHLVVANGATVPDYLNWDVSTAIATRLGRDDVPTLLLTQGCAAAVLAFQQIAGLFAVRPEITTVLLVAVDRVSERHTARLGPATVDSDGAVAVVLRRGHPELRWRATEQVTDAEYSDFFRLEFCGAAAPCGSDPRRNLRVDPAHQVYRHFQRTPEALVAWATEVDLRVVSAVDGACKRAGVARGDLSRLVLLNDNQRSLATVAEAAGLPVDRTNAELAATLGHFGGADPLVCLSVYRERAALAPGELVALAGMSSGMHWFCTLIEV